MSPPRCFPQLLLNHSSSLTRAAPAQPFALSWTPSPLCPAGRSHSLPHQMGFLGSPRRVQGLGRQVHEPELPCPWRSSIGCRRQFLSFLNHELYMCH